MDASSPVKDALRNSCISETGSWRTDPKLFHSRADGIRGCVNMSPAWYQQGHGVAGAPPEVGAMLKAKNAKNGGREWLEKMGETNALLAGAISVMHPELYAVGREVMLTVARKARTQGIEDMADVIGKWGSIFSAASVMLNRETPYHRDHNSPAEGFDLLATVGPYKEAWMSVPTLARRFLYNAGTVMAFSGHLLRHGVVRVDDEDRTCVAYYMREKVLGWAGMESAKFMRYDLLDAVGQAINSHRVYMLPGTEGR